MDGTHNEHTGDARDVVMAGSIGHLYIGTHTRPPAARPITEWDPFALGVHHAITADDAVTPLPAYLSRDHDHQLDEALRDTGKSQMIVLVGSSSTGKTRALYEAISRHDTLRTWPVRCPRTTDQLLADDIPPNTVLWLNETQDYLTTEVAGHLQSLLDGALPGPVIVLGTVWPTYWRDLTMPSTPTRHLLDRVHRIDVAERFVDEIPDTADPRIREAAHAAGPQRKVIQTLAGGPLVVDRYEHPRTTRDRYARAVLAAAVDANRLGFRSPLTAEFLRAAAGGYLDEADRVDTPVDWFSEGLDSSTHDLAHGITALIAIRSAPGPGPATGYRLHDYLYQYAGIARHNELTTATLWDALVIHARDLTEYWQLRRAALDRMFYRYAEEFDHTGRDRLMLSALLTIPGTTEGLQALSALGLVSASDPVIDDDDAAKMLAVLRRQAEDPILRSEMIMRLRRHERIDEIRNLVHNEDSALFHLLNAIDNQMRARAGDPAAAVRIARELVRDDKFDNALALLRQHIGHDVVDRELRELRVQHWPATSLTAPADARIPPAEQRPPDVDAAEYLRQLCRRIVRGDSNAVLLLRDGATSGALAGAHLVLRNGLEPDGSVSAARRQNEREDGGGAGAAE